MSNDWQFTPLITILAIWAIIEYFYLRWIYRMAEETDKPPWLWIIYSQLGPFGPWFTAYLYGYVRGQRANRVALVKGNEQGGKL